MTYHVQFPGLGLEFTLDRVAFTVFGLSLIHISEPTRH